MEQPRRKPVAYVVSEELVKLSSLLPSNKNRSFVVHSLISALRLPHLQSIDGEKCFQILRPGRASPKDLLVYHTREYLEYALNPSNVTELSPEGLQGAEFGLEDDCPPFRGLREYIQLVAGATLTAVGALKDDIADIAICWDGGRHHAQKSHASGFCYVADCVLAILALRRPTSLTVSSRKPRVMYLDLDLHFSDGVSQAFYSTSSTGASQVLTLSIHHASPGFFPISTLSGLPDTDASSFDPFCLSLPLRQGASNRTFLRIWPIVERIRDIFDPDYFVIQCGVDGLAGDPLATWNWSLGGEGSLGWCVGRIVDRWQGKKLFLGGGGYNSANAARAWAHLTSIAAAKPLPLDTEIPDHRAFPLYQPSFTLDIAAGNMQDHNTEEYIQTVEACFENASAVLRSRLVSM
ncbi:Arginase/deacetylase [Leucogyrophana mollusca]|uniref:Arginase/deacetylase n=1 Tax=Leucogyrophana mollusca TaxID=85980 RepID=A0ACB8B9W2_9AGAM|nr:Arginase/deacetylase [Leucogyrophana mollusca]